MGSSTSSRSSSSDSRNRISSSESRSPVHKGECKETTDRVVVEQADDNPEVAKAKAESLEKVLKLRDSGLEVEERRRQWRILLREWHPDKHDNKELATAV